MPLFIVINISPFIRNLLAPLSIQIKNYKIKITKHAVKAELNYNSQQWMIVVNILEEELQQARIEMEHN